MIFVTGDTHGFNGFGKLEYFSMVAEQNGVTLTKDDYVIIAGDAGIVWSEEENQVRISAYEKLPFSILFIDGNHENFDMLDALPVEMWNGGKVHKISESIIHLMRGQVFEICGKTFFTFGGGVSFDQELRKKGVSWWEQEIPSPQDLNEAHENLKAHGNKVNFVITHACGDRALYYLGIKSRKIFNSDVVTSMLSNFEKLVEFDKWFFGHYHVDAILTDNKIALLDEFFKVVD